MKVLKTETLLATDRHVNCPKGGFRSLRVLLEKDGMGYTVTETTIPPLVPSVWHYKKHKETCYCVRGKAVLTNLETEEQFIIEPGTVYILDKNDRHAFLALEETVLVCVFNPPLKGKEVHREDGSYEQ